MSRTLVLSGNINEESIKYIIKDIYDWNLQDDKSEQETKNFTREPINLIINSYGGNTHDGFGLANMIKSSKTPIHTICIGEAMSAGFIIFIAGHKRYCYNGSTFLYHQSSHRIDGQLEYVKNIIDFNKKMLERINKFITSQTKISNTQLNDYCNRNSDWYIEPEEALELDIVHEIL